MRQSKKQNSQFMQRATSSVNLMQRVRDNRNYAKKDFNQWVKMLLDGVSFNNVLDLCCGTGNQLVLYAAKPDVKEIVGIDISKEALTIAEERLEKIPTNARINLKAINMEDISKDKELSGKSFELISCFYGLYYSDDAKTTLKDMARLLTKNGAMLIVGPYGENNRSLFGILERHLKLPDKVVYGSSFFMEEEAYPALRESYDIEKNTFLNQICYPDTKSLMDYWRASTFYSAEHEDAVAKEIERHFKKNKEFVVEKHVMAYLARRKG